MALTIPVKDDIEKRSLDALENVRDILTESQKKDVQTRREVLELEEKKRNRDIQLYKLFALGEMGPSQYKYLKLKNKLTTEYHKWFVKRKFFVKLKQWFKNVAKSSEGFLSKVLKSLFLLAIFDPKGKFLASILKFIIGMVVKFIEIFIKWAPIILKRMWDLTTNVILPALKDLGQKIAVALGFAPGGAMYKIFGVLAQVLPIAFLLMGAVSKLMPALKTFKTVISTVGSGLYKLSNLIFKFFSSQKDLTLKQWAWEKALKLKKWLWEKAMMIKKFIFEKVLAMMNPIFLIITVVIAAIALIYKFRKQILGFFKMIGKKIYGVLKPILDPIIKFFKWVSGKLGKVFGKIAGFFINLGKKMSFILTPIKKFFSLIGSGFKKLFGFIKELINEHIATGQAIKSVGFMNYLSASSEEKSKYKKVAMAQVKAQEVIELAGKKDSGIRKGSKEYETARYILNKTSTEEGFKEFAKNWQVQKAIDKLDRTISKGEKNVELKEALRENAKATKENNKLTKEQMRQKQLETSQGFKRLKDIFPPQSKFDSVGMVNIVGGTGSFQS